MKNIFVLLVALLIAAFCLAGCETAEPDDSDVATNPPMTEAPETEPPVTENGTVLSIDELRELNYMTADEVEAKYGARKYEYTMNGGTPVYSIESLPGVFLVYSGYGSINDGYEPIVGDASGIILTDGYAGNIHGVYVGMDLSSADIEWDAINLSLNSGLSLVKTFGNLGITVGIRDAEGDIPNESNTTEEWDAWKTSYKEKPTGFIHSIYVVLASETATIPEINEADYVVKDGVLTSYVGTSIVVNIPDTVKEIAANAFANSPVAGSITEINIGPNVEKISINAFAGLPSLVKVNIDPANPYFISGESEYGYGQYILSLNEPVAFYFSCKDDEPGKNTRNDKLYIPCFEDNHITAAFKPYERFSLFWNNAIFEIEHHEDLGTEFFNIYSVKYGDQIIDFSEKPINNAWYMAMAFKTELGFVLQFNYPRSSGYVFTANKILRTPHVLFLYKNELGELCYYEEDDGYMDREQVVDPYSYRITSRDYPLTEEGVIKLVNGELIKEPQKILTISEYFISQGTTIDEWFEEVSINDFDSLEEMFEHNKTKNNSNTEPPVTEAPPANPIASFEFEKFIPEDKKDPDCTVGFILQAQKFTYLGNDLVLLHITNTTSTDYAISLTVKYLDSNGKTIHGLRDKYEDFGAGWDNYLVYDPDFAFDSFSCSLTISSPCKNSVTKYLTDGGNSILFSTESSGYSWLDRSTGESRSLNSPNVAAIAGFPHVNEYSESLHYIADYILFDKDGNIIFYDKSRIPVVAAPGENIDSVPVYLSDTRWSQKDKATLPDNFTGEAIGIIAYKSVLTHDGSIPHSKKATTEEFGYYTFQASNGIDMPYRLFLPRNYDPSKKYPVVTIFHAHGSQGNDNKLQLRDVEKFFGDDKSPIYDCIVYSPQCPLNGWWLGENVDAAMEGLDFINSYYSTDKSRQYFTGTSMGGCGVWNVLSRYPEKVSAAIPCAYYGGFSTANEPYGPSNPATQPAISPEMLEIPICYIYSAADETIPAEGCRNVVAAFEAVNASNFSYEEQQGVDHGTLGASYISKYNGYRLLYWLLKVVRETE